MQAGLKDFIRFSFGIGDRSPHVECGVWALVSLDLPKELVGDSVKWHTDGSRESPSAVRISAWTVAAVHAFFLPFSIFTTTLGIPETSALSKGSTKHRFSPP